MILAHELWWRPTSVCMRMWKDFKRTFCLQHHMFIIVKLILSMSAKGWVLEIQHWLWYPESHVPWLQNRQWTKTSCVILHLCIGILRLSPRRFGEPSSRTRLWRILLNPERVCWVCPLSFEELAQTILLPLDAPLKLSPQVYFFLDSDDTEEELCESAQNHLRDFPTLAPNKRYYDLASNPNHRLRTETCDGALMTLTTNSRIWCLG